MSNKRSQMIALMGMALMVENPMTRNYIQHEPIEIQPRPPKGSKEYFFNGRGNFQRNKC